MKNWELIFKSLANINRLKIVKMLSLKKEGLNVTQMSEKLKISIRATSRHLILLKNMRVLESEGKEGHVVYFLGDNISVDFKKVLKLFL